MKVATILVFILSTILSSSLALQHQVRVYLKKSGGDFGATVELRTTVQFNLPFGTTSQQTFNSELLAENEFPGFGEILFDRDFNSDPVSILFTVIEDDGGEATNDGVCRLLAQPHSWPVGTYRFDCIRESNNGVNQDWHIIMLVDSS